MSVPSRSIPLQLATRRDSSRMPLAPKKRRLLYPEPGTWGTDATPPDSLPRGKLSAEEVQDRVSHDGLGFCIYELISDKKIADPRLANLWREARHAMLNVVKCLGAAPEVQVIIDDGEDVTDNDLEI